jgi:hypothetical protein
MSVIAAAKGPLTTDLNPGDVAKQTTGWTAAGDGTPALTNLVRQGGGIQLAPQGTTDNHTVTANWGGRSVMPGTVHNRFGFDAVVKVTEAATNVANWSIGFSSVVGATFTGDTGLLADMTAVLINKREASMFFRSVAKVVAADSGELTSRPVVSGTEYRITVDAQVFKDGLTVEFRVDGELVSKVEGVDITSAVEMYPVIHVANGSAANQPIQVLQYRPYANAG